jgi:hypothetical protein
MVMYKDRQDMKAVYITKYGGSDQLVYGPLQRPEPKSGKYWSACERPQSIHVTGFFGMVATFSSSPQYPARSRGKIVLEIE